MARCPRKMCPPSDNHFAENFRCGYEDQARRSDTRHMKLSQQVGRRHNDRHVDRVVLANELHHCDGPLRLRRNCEAVEIVITTHQNALKPAILSSEVQIFLRRGTAPPPRRLAVAPHPSFSNVGISVIWIQTRTCGLFWRTRSGCTTSTVPLSWRQGSFHSYQNSLKPAILSSKIKIFHSYQNALKPVWNPNIEKELLEKLAFSMTDHLRAVIKAHGGPTNYWTVTGHLFVHLKYFGDNFISR